MTVYKGLLNANFDYRGTSQVAGTQQGCISQEMFVTINNFLSSPAALSLGITRRANNKGSTTDRGINTGFSIGGSASMGYWDSDSPAGNNAWALYEFTQASPPLWLLIQFSGYSTSTFGGVVGGSQFGESPGSPAMVGSQGGGTHPNSVAISCAFRKDATSPWNGTKLNVGSDTKGSSVWNSGSVIFPRSNAFGGSNESLGEDMMRLMVEENIFVVNASASLDASSGIYHVIASNESILILTDNRGIGDYNILFAGKYDPINTAISESLNWANYVCLHTHNTSDGLNRVILPREGDALSSYGPRNGSTSLYSVQADNNYTQVGGGANNVVTNRVESCIIDSNFLLSDTATNTPIHLRHPNRAISDPTGRTPGKFDMFTIPIACYGDHFGYGKLGQISSFYMVFGLASNTTLNNKQYAVFGNSSLNTIKLAVPWDGISVPGTAGSREGIPF